MTRYLHRLKHRRHGARRPHRKPGVASAKQDGFTAVEVCRHNAQRQRHGLNQLARHLRVDIARHRLPPQHAAVEQRQCPVGQHGLFHGFGNLLQLRAIFATGINGGDQAAGRRTRHQIHLDARFFQHLNHPDVGEPAGRPAAQRQADSGRFFDYRLDYHRWRLHGRLRRSGGAAAQSPTGNHCQHHQTPARKSGSASRVIIKNDSCLRYHWRCICKLIRQTLAVEAAETRKSPC